MDEELSLTEHSDRTERLDAIEKLIVLWDPSIYHLPVLRGHYFLTVDEVISLSTCGFPDHLQTRAERILEVTMSRLEDKFCRLMMRNHFLTETDLPSVSDQSISVHPLHRTNTVTSDHYNQRSHNAATPSRTNSASTTPQTSSGTNTRSSGIVSFSSNSAGHPDEYRSLQESHFGSIVDASEIFIGDISDMKAIAHRMFRANCGSRLTRAFVTACTEIVINDFSLMGFQELTKEEAQNLPWDALSREMKNWVRATKVTFQVILPRKRWLCDEIFGTEMNGAVFDEAAKSSVMRLIKFAKAASFRKGSPKIIFHLLSMYETLIDALAGVEKLFSDIANEFLYGEIEGTIDDIGEAVLCILPVWLDELAQNHLSRTEEGQEGIHPFTKYAIAYISLLVVNHRHSLNILLHDEVVTATGNDAVLQGQSEMTPLGHTVLTLLSNLNSVLEHKSKKMEPRMQEIFLINNLHYVLNLVKDSVLKLQLSDDWFRELHERIDRLLSRYLKSCWGNMLASLIDKNLRQRKGMLFVPTYKAVVRQKLKSFKSVFEATCSLQSSWKVPNPELRQELRRAISETVVPVYKSFLAENHIDVNMYIPKPLEDSIFGLFEGS